MKRIFVGIAILEELKEEILCWEQNYKFQITNFKLNPENSIRWIALKNLHVTLVPPWPSSGWQVESNKLKVIKFAPFEIKFDSVSFGPNSKEPRMIWVKGQAGKEIKKLKKLIEIALIGSVSIKCGRTFNQHVTLARLALHPAPADAGRNRSKATGAGFRPEDFANFSVKDLNEKIDWRQIVKSFVLYESHLSPQGADYEVLEEFPCNASTKYEKN